MRSDETPVEPNNDIFVCVYVPRHAASKALALCSGCGRPSQDTGRDVVLKRCVRRFYVNRRSLLVNGHGRLPADKETIGLFLRNKQ
jgi:hypothetical protein